MILIDRVAWQIAMLLHYLLITKLRKYLVWQMISAEKTHIVIYGMAIHIRTVHGRADALQFF